MAPRSCFRSRAFRAVSLLAFSLVLLLGPAGPARAQAPAFGLALPIGTNTATGSARGGATTTDAQGNIYLTGSFLGTVGFGPTTLTSRGSWDAFIAKLDAAGHYVWAVQAGGPGADGAASVAVDALGTVYAAGSFEGSASFGFSTLQATTNPTHSDLWVGRLDADGTWIWVNGGGGGYSDGAGALVLAADGSVYVGGTFGSTTAYFGPFTVQNSDPGASNIGDLLIAKLDAFGNWLWVRTGGGTGYDWVRSLALDAQGRLFAYGSMQSAPATFGPLSITTMTYGNDDVYVAQLDADGTWRWVRSAGGSFIDYSGGMALDGAGNAYVAGSFRSPSMQFGSLTLPNRSGTNQVADAYVAKIDGSGTWLWATGAGGAAADAINGLAVSSAGQVTVTGSFGSSTAQFGATVLTNSSTAPPYGLPNTDAFLARLDAGGTWLGAVGSQGAGSEAGQRISLDQSGNALLTGTFRGSSATFGATTLPGGPDAEYGFLTLVPGPVGPPTVATLAPGSGGAGQVVTLTGNRLAGVTQVLFNGTPATAFRERSYTRLEATVPAGVTTGPVTVSTGAGTGTSSGLFRVTVLAAAGPPAAPALLVWPNPVDAATPLRLQLPETGPVPATTQAELRNALGQLVRTAQFGGRSTTLSVRGLPPGVYHLTLRPAGQAALSRRVAVQ